MRRCRALDCSLEVNHRDLDARMRVADLVRIVLSHTNKTETLAKVECCVPSEDVSDFGASCDHGVESCALLSWRLLFLQFRRRAGECRGGDQLAHCHSHKQRLSTDLMRFISLPASCCPYARFYWAMRLSLMLACTQQPEPPLPVRFLSHDHNIREMRDKRVRGLGKWRENTTHCSNRALRNAAVLQRYRTP